MTFDLFSFEREQLRPGAVLLREFAKPLDEYFLTILHEIVIHAPFRHMITPGGYKMSVAMTNCGQSGWISDKHGYRYDAIDPISGNHWPEMPISYK